MYGKAECWNVFTESSGIEFFDFFDHGLNVCRRSKSIRFDFLDGVSLLSGYLYGNFRK